MNYAFEHAGAVYTPNPDGPGVTNVNAHNDALEAAELAQWATAPDRFAGYIAETPEPRGVSINERFLTTWRGVKLGKVIAWRVYRNNLGARVAAVRIRGNNGAEYYGRMGVDWNQLIRLRRAKA